MPFDVVSHTTVAVMYLGSRVADKTPQWHIRYLPHQVNRPQVVPAVVAASSRAQRRSGRHNTGEKCIPQVKPRAKDEGLQYHGHHHIHVD